MDQRGSEEIVAGITASGDEVWLVPVADIIEHYNPLTKWDDRFIISLTVIEDAIRLNVLDERPFGTICRSSECLKWTADEAKTYHAARCAYLVLNPDAKPIEIDVGVPCLGSYPYNGNLDLEDGHHRLSAALYRGDTYIALTYGGECSRFEELFPDRRLIFTQEGIHDGDLGRRIQHL